MTVPFDLGTGGLSVTQTPIAEIKESGAITTGSFFGIPDQPQFQGSHDLLGGASFSTSGGSSLVLMAGAFLVLALMVKK